MFLKASFSCCQISKRICINYFLKNQIKNLVSSLKYFVCSLNLSFLVALFSHRRRSSFSSISGRPSRARACEWLARTCWRRLFCDGVCCILIPLLCRRRWFLCVLSSILPFLLRFFAFWCAFGDLKWRFEEVIAFFFNRESRGDNAAAVCCCCLVDAVVCDSSPNIGSFFLQAFTPVYLLWGCVL